VYRVNIGIVDVQGRPPPP